MFGTLDPVEIETLLNRQLIGRIGCHTADKVYVVPISYAYDGEYIYGHAFEGLKIDMMRQNPSVCFEVDDTHNLATWQSVICWGHFEELAQGASREAAVHILEKRVLPVLHSQTMRLESTWPFHSGHNEVIKGIIFRIKLGEKTGRFERANDQFFFSS